MNIDDSDSDNIHAGGDNCIRDVDRSPGDDLATAADHHDHHDGTCTHDNDADARTPDDRNSSA